MSLDELNAELAKPRGGKWAKLSEVGDRLVGTILDGETVNRTDPEGNVVLGKKSGKPRRVYRLRLQTDLRDDPEDDGVRIFDANESAQDALRACAPLQIGAQLAIAIVGAPADKWSQATYKAQQKTVAEPLPTEDPFAGL
jgi:hypothetical protein